jgi:hypothetical protein
MKQYAGLVIGIIYLLIAFAAFRSSMAGWDRGAADLGVWWTVVGSLLTIAGGGALIGTWIHAWSGSEEGH